MSRGLPEKRSRSSDEGNWRPSRQPNNLTATTVQRSNTLCIGFHSITKIFWYVSINVTSRVAYFLRYLKKRMPLLTSGWRCGQIRGESSTEGGASARFLDRVCVLRAKGKGSLRQKSCTKSVADITQPNTNTSTRRRIRGNQWANCHWLSRKSSNMVK